MEGHTSGRNVATLETTADVLDSLVEIEGGTVTEIANHSGLAKSTVHAHLKTLRENDYVAQDGDVYDVGLRFLDLGLRARNRIAGFPMIRQKAEVLAAEAGELVVFIVEENGRGFVTTRERGPNAVETEVQTGNRVPLHATAGGKAILANLPEDRVAEILDRRGLTRKTDGTITDESAFYDELDRVRARGYAISAEEHTDGLHSFSAPVFGDGGHLVGALSVSGPSNRMKNDEYRSEITELLLGAVNELELKIRYS